MFLAIVAIILTLTLQPVFAGNRASVPGSGCREIEMIASLFERAKNPRLPQVTSESQARYAIGYLHFRDPRLTKILSKNTRLEDLENYQYRLGAIQDGSRKMLITERSSKKTKTILIPWDQFRELKHRAITEQKMDFGLKLKSQNIKKTTQILDATDFSRHEDILFMENALAATLFRYSGPIDKAIAQAAQTAIYNIQAGKRMTDILGGKLPISRYSDLIMDEPVSFAWSKLVLESGHSENLDRFISVGRRRGIDHLIIQESAIPQTIPADAPLEALITLSQRNSDKVNYLDSIDPPYVQSVHFNSKSGKTVNIHLLDGSGLKKATQEYPAFADAVVPTQWQNAPEDIRRYIRARYAAELNIQSTQLDELIKMSEQMQDRTQYVFITEEPFAHHAWVEGQTYVHHTQSYAPTRRLKYTDFDHFKIKGSMSLVSSSSVSEKLPLELFTGHAIVRPAQGKRVVELGRFSVDPELRPVGPRQIWKMAGMVASQSDVGKIVAVTTKPYAEELIQRFGFKKVFEDLNFEGKPEYIIEITPEEFFSRAAVLLKK